MKKSVTRRAESIAKIKHQGIACNDFLPMLEEASHVKLKDVNQICKRVFACFISLQLACDITDDCDYTESQKGYSKVLNFFNVENMLTKKESRLFDGSYSLQDAVDVTWTSESFWSLIWALGLVDDMCPDYTCDSEMGVQVMSACDDLQQFASSCRVRDIEEILDMLDLYYCYDWACVENQFNTDSNIGELNPSVVLERRRGLEWLISPESDWDEISLDT